MRDLFPVLRVLGVLMVFFALSMKSPLAVSWLWQDGMWQAWPASMLVTAVVGVLVVLHAPPQARASSSRHGVILVTLVGVPAFECGAAHDVRSTTRWAKTCRSLMPTLRRFQG